MDLEPVRNHAAPAERLAAGVAEFETYIRNNQESIPNYGKRHRQGETISTAFVESTINQVVSRRFVKRQQMHWTLRGAHLVLQTRTKVLNNELEESVSAMVPTVPNPSESCVTPEFLLLSISEDLLAAEEQASKILLTYFSDKLISENKRSNKAQLTHEG